MYIISTELDPEDINLFHDVYDMIAINKNSDAFQNLKSDVKNKKKPFLFFVTRNFEIIYRICVITQITKYKEQLFENQIELMSICPNYILHTKYHKTLFLTQQKLNNLLESYGLPNTLYKTHDALSDFLIKHLISTPPILITDLVLNVPEPNIVYKTFLFTMSYPINSLEHVRFGINSTKIDSSEEITAGSYIFFVTESKISGFIRVKNIRYVSRLNKIRFINNYSVTPLHDNWNIEIEIDLSSEAKYFYDKTKLSLKKDFQIPSRLNIIQQVHSKYIDEYIKIYDTLPSVIHEESHDNYFDDQIEKINDLKRIYVLSTISTHNLYTKLNVNNQYSIFVDVNPSFFFKLNTKHWDKNTLKQFLQDIKENKAYLLLTTKNHDKFFMSMKVVQLSKYKSLKDKILSICPYAWILDYKYDADLFGSYGILPIMLKEKNMWKTNNQIFGQNVKSYPEISHVITNLSERRLHVFTDKDKDDRLDMFNYLKEYLKYENKARLENTFVNFTREQIETYSDVISKDDYDLPLKIYWLP